MREKEGTKAGRIRAAAGWTLLAATGLMYAGIRVTGAGQAQDAGTVVTTVTGSVSPAGSSGAGEALPPIPVPDGWLSVNEADIHELTELTGIGETTAANLISEREENGSFFYPEDLLSVKGIGKKKLAEIREELNFSQPENE